MNKRRFNITVGIIFSLIFLLHAARISFDWMVVVERVEIPMWASVLAVLIAGPLALLSFRYKDGK